MIETLSPVVVEEMLTPQGDDKLDQDFMEKLEIIFQNPACLNASFLLPSHKPCTSKNEGKCMKTFYRNSSFSVFFMQKIVYFLLKLF